VPNANTKNASEGHIFVFEGCGWEMNTPLSHVSSRGGYVGWGRGVVGGVVVDALRLAFQARQLRQ